MTLAIRIALLLLSVVPSVAAAQAEDPALDRLIDEGLALRQSARDTEALARFEEAWQRFQAPRALAQIALAEQALGRWADAEAHLTDALATDDPWIEERRGVLERELGRIGERLGSLEVLGVEGARIRLDGREVGTLPLARPLRVLPGVVRLEISAEGYTTVIRSIEIEAGQLARASIDLVPSEPPREIPAEPAPPEPAPLPEPEPVVAPAPEPEPAPASDGGALVALGAVQIGVGVAGLAIGAGLAAWREDLVRAFNDDDCLADRTQTRGEQCASFWEDGHAAETGAIVSFAVGGAALAVGVVLLLVGVGGDGDETSSALSCGPGPGAIGVACGGAF